MVGHFQKQLGGRIPARNQDENERSTSVVKALRKGPSTWPKNKTQRQRE